MEQSLIDIKKININLYGKLEENSNNLQKIEKIDDLYDNYFLYINWKKSEVENYIDRIDLETKMIYNKCQEMINELYYTCEGSEMDNFLKSNNEILSSFNSARNIMDKKADLLRTKEKQLEEREKLLNEKIANLTKEDKEYIINCYSTYNTNSKGDFYVEVMKDNGFNNIYEKLLQYYEEYKLYIQNRQKDKLVTDNFDAEKYLEEMENLITIQNNILNSVPNMLKNNSEAYDISVLNEVLNTNVQSKPNKILKIENKPSNKAITRNSDQNNLYSHARTGSLPLKKSSAELIDDKRESIKKVNNKNGYSGRKSNGRLQLNDKKKNNEDEIVMKSSSGIQSTRLKNSVRKSDESINSKGILNSKLFNKDKKLNAKIFNK